MTDEKVLAALGEQLDAARQSPSVDALRVVFAELRAAVDSALARLCPHPEGDLTSNVDWIVCTACGTRWSNLSPAGEGIER